MTDSTPFAAYTARLRQFIRRHDLGQNARVSAQPATDATDADFNALALELFALQFAHVPIYRQFCEARGTAPATVARWEDIPALPIVAFKEFEVTSLAPGERTAVFHSSGTTAQIPSRHFHDPGSLSIYEASLRPPFEQHVLAGREHAIEQGGRGADEPLPFILLAPPPGLAPHSSLAHMFETVRRHCGARDSVFTGQIEATGAWQLDLDATLRAIRKSLCGPRPVALLGTAFSFVHLLDHFAAHNLRYRLREGSRVMETGGYKGRSRALPKAELHALITRRLGIPSSHIVCEYGMSELSSQAYDRAAGSEVPRVFRFPPWARAQVISPETGRPATDATTGLLRVFDLANVRSVLALQTEDLAAWRGDGFEWLGRAHQAEPRGCSRLAV